MNLEDFPFNEFADGKSEEQLVQHITSLSEVCETIIGGKKYTSTSKISKEDVVKILAAYVKVGVIDESYLPPKWHNITVSNNSAK